ncbi:Ribonuclease HII [Chlamydiales bacterium SCGC AB-751-O23]|jgi:ribonuclease HII|nr:Ribonuclease HII [Chlamydiales bacterium SCGC AB-751-O23]
MQSSEEQRLGVMWKFEDLAYKNFKLVAGVDEAGRGPLAGPVVAAACILPFAMLIEGLDDSKKLSPKKRQKLFEYLSKHDDIYFAYSVIDASIVDEINIYEATKVAMKEAIITLQPAPDFVLVDGMALSVDGFDTQKLIKGDSLSCSIAAASIVAKETRDALMRQADEKWPEYGFAKNKGYGTKEHMKALEKYGPCPFHRKSFSPIKEMVLT